MKIEVEHKLSSTEAKNRIKNLVSNIRKQFGDKIEDEYENWNENNCNFAFTVNNLKLEGSLTIEESKVIIFGKLPLIARIFQSKIEEKIKAEAEKLLS